VPQSGWNDRMATLPSLERIASPGQQDNERESLCRVVRELGAQGWCQGTGGNFSLTLDHAPLRLLLTRSGVDKRRLGPADLMLVGPDGRPAPGETGRPSAEALLHGRIVAATGAAAVLHVHSVANTLLSEHFAPRGGFTLSGYEMLKGLSGVMTHETAVHVPVLANSQDIPRLGDEVASLFGAHPALWGFLLAGHGLYTWGGSLDEARRHVEIFEFLFECVARRTPFRPFVG
jgi:methylthioribulose-1-phosphate dehydratase